MLYFVGLGLSSEKDVSVAGLEVIKRATRVYLESYTAVLVVGQHELESFYGRAIILADREMVESHSDQILAGADKVDVAFLVVGDPFGATTHTDLSLRARQLKIPIRTLPNASILTGVGATGLSLYNFGQTISMVWFTDNWRPTSWYPRLQENASIGLHSLVLLDIKVKEPDLDVLARTGKMKYLPPRFMSVAECAKQMIEVEDELRGGVCSRDALAVGVSRVGSEDMQIVAGTLEQLCETDLGRPLHSLVLVGRRGHELERDFLEDFAADKELFRSIWDRNYGKQN